MERSKEALCKLMRHSRAKALRDELYSNPCPPRTPESRVRFKHAQNSSNSAAAIKKKSKQGGPKNAARTSLVPTTRCPPSRSSLLTFLLQTPPRPRTPDKLERPPPLLPPGVLPLAQLSLLLLPRLPNSSSEECPPSSQHRGSATRTASRLGP